MVQVYACYTRWLASPIVIVIGLTEDVGLPEGVALSQGVALSVSLSEGAISNSGLRFV